MSRNSHPEIYQRIIFILFLSIFFALFSLNYNNVDFYYTIITIGIFIQLLIFIPYYMIILKLKNVLFNFIILLSIIIYSYSFFISKVKYNLYFLCTIIIYIIFCRFFSNREEIKTENNRLQKITPIKFFGTNKTYFFSLLISIVLSILICTFINI